ncbi:hypothetical protein GIB67_008187, partial [Kingdonia uniflora]
MSPIKEVTSKAKIIRKFLYSRETVLKLVSKHVSERSPVNSSRIRSMRPSLTLENIVLEKENLQKMIGSSAWNTSIWTSRADGKRVANLIEGLPFWSEAKKVLKATIPLVRALHLVNGGDSKPQMGYIYETMDQVKETIKEEFENKKIAGELLCCIVRMVEDRKIQDLILQQLDEYQEAKGPFGWINVVDQRSEIPPEKWWSLYGVWLRDYESNAKEGDGNSDEMIDPMDDWIVDEAVTPQSNVDSIAWMDSNTIDNEEEP